VEEMDIANATPRVAQCGARKKAFATGSDIQAGFTGVLNGNSIVSTDILSAKTCDEDYGQAFPYYYTSGPGAATTSRSS
jgi:hypothetical protein